MNIYDFDGTIYKGDSTIDFYEFVLRRHPKVLLSLPKQSMGFFKYKLGKSTLTQFKESFFSFLDKIEDCEREIQLFWDEATINIENWYIGIKKSDDLVISASPEFLIAEACKRLGIREPIATVCDARTGKISGDNCKGSEKLRRYREVYGEEPIDSFFSDSLSDLPLASIAKKAFFVKDSSISEWIIES